MLLLKGWLKIHGWRSSCLLAVVYYYYCCLRTNVRNTFLLIIMHVSYCLSVWICCVVHLSLSNCHFNLFKCLLLHQGSRISSFSGILKAVTMSGNGKRHVVYEGQNSNGERYKCFNDGAYTYNNSSGSHYHNTAPCVFTGGQMFLWYFLIIFSLSCPQPLWEINVDVIYDN